MFEGCTGSESDGSAMGVADASTVLSRLSGIATEVLRAADETATCERWTAEQRAGALARLDRLAGALATLRGRLLRAELAAGTGVAEGDRDLVAARARTTRGGLGGARREVRQAQTLAALPEGAAAVADGRVPLPHLDVLGRATAEVGERAADALASPEGQRRLVAMAERLSVREFSGAVTRLVATYEPAVLERGLAAQRAARFLVLSRQPDGVHLRGRLDVVAGAALRAALDAVGAAPDDDRDKAQADADALVAVAERSLSGMAGVRTAGTTGVPSELAGAGAPGGTGVPGGQGGPGGSGRAGSRGERVSGVAGRPLLSVLVPVGTFVALKEARRAQGDATAAGGAAGAEDAGGLMVPATLDDGTPVPASELARLMCDAEVGRVVVDAASVPIDLGRTSRLFSAAQRRAVIIRDRVCAWNGCEVPAAYGELHHIRWWDRDGGPSDLENAVLLCSHHHHVVHQLDLTIARVCQARGPGDGDPARYEFRFASGGRSGRVVSAPVGAVSAAGAAA